MGWVAFVYTAIFSDDLLLYFSLADHYKHQRWKDPWDTGQSITPSAAHLNLSSIPPHHRRRRAISAERHVEVLLVADYHMKKYHELNDLRHYLLTLMSIVSQ
jgi:hypothetical protein